jgi:hypothetical protein
MAERLIFSPQVGRSPMEIPSNILVQVMLILIMKAHHIFYLPALITTYRRI